MRRSRLRTFLSIQIVSSSTSSSNPILLTHLLLRLNRSFFEVLQTLFNLILSHSSKLSIMIQFLTLLLSITCLVAQIQAKTIMVNVGDGGKLVFNPDSVTAAKGDMVQFNYVKGVSRLLRNPLNILKRLPVECNTQTYLEREN